MNSKPMLFTFMTAAIAAGMGMVSCSSGSDEPGTGPDPVVPAPGTDKYGLKAETVDSFFVSSINGEGGTFKGGEEIANTSIPVAKAYVWDLWTKALRRNANEKLPQLSQHTNVGSWADLTTPDGTWKMPDGNLKFFYGSKGDRPSAGYPLTLFLHGSGNDPHAEWTATLSWLHYFQDSPMVYFAPESPKGGTGCRWYQPSRQAKWENLLRNVLAGTDIDPKRIHIAGISEGAYGTQRLASFYADYLAGAGPIAGGETLINCPPENLAHVAYIMQTGSLDTMYGRTLLTNKVGKELDRLGQEHPGLYVHKVDLQPGKEHGCDYTVTTPWLKDRVRTTNPKYVYWENCPLGNINGEPLRYRDAFYNLRVVEPSDARDNELVRSVYEMNINDNVIDLKVSTVSVEATEPAFGEGWSMKVGVEKTYTQATTGRVGIYLSDALVDLKNPVVVRVNGVEKYNATPTLSSSTLVESCALYFDPERLYPAYVEVSVD